MNNQIWSFVLSIVGVAGFVLAGKKIWWAWYINIACQGLWLAYALVTDQYGFILGAFVYTAVFVKNAIGWTKEHLKLKRFENEEFVDKMQLVYNQTKSLLNKFNANGNHCSGHPDVPPGIHIDCGVIKIPHATHSWRMDR